MLARDVQQARPDDYDLEVYRCGRFLEPSP